jgi:hypothetical protein
MICISWKTTTGYRHTTTIKSAVLSQSNKSSSTKQGDDIIKQKLQQQLYSQLLQTRDTVVDNKTCNNLNLLSLVARGGASSSYNDDNDGYYNNDRGYDYENSNNSRGTSSYDGRDDYGYGGSYYEDERGGNSNNNGNNNGWYDDEGRYHDDDYDDRGGGGGGNRRRRSSTTGISKPKLPSALTGSNRKLGILFLSSGAIFTILGITLFFNKTLMRLGNLLFVAGVPLMIGTGRTVGYFLQPQKARATGCLVCGIFLVFVGHPVLGILLEVFGLLNLFGNMFPLVMMMARNVPVLGGLFSGSSNNNGGGGSRRGERRRRESDYDDRYRYDDRYNDDERYREDDYRY